VARARAWAAVLHGGWVLASDGVPAGFAIWGEQSPNVRVRPRTPRRRAAIEARPTFGRPIPPPQPPPLPHPFALNDDGVRHALSMLGLTRWATQTHVRQIVACLPSSDAGPYRSSEPIDPEASPRLTPWSAWAVILNEVASVSLLPRIAAASAANPGLLGDDLRAWIVAARFALSLLARQRFLPRLQSSDGDLVSRWSPVIDDPADRANLHAIERAMPAASVALTWATSTSSASAHDALADYLAAVIDGVARDAHPEPGKPAHVPAAVGAWLAALGRMDPLVQLPDDAARSLRRQVGAWIELSVDGATEDAFRLCFRLDPPSGDEPSHDERRWRLEYLLQATDDPSLLVPVGEVWRHRGHTARFLTRRFDQPQERVLAALGRASPVFGPIEASLRSPRPESCALSTREAADLVRDKALLLKASGFGVLLPGLDTRLNVRLRLRGPREPDPARSEGPSLLTFNSLVGYDWQLALGDQPLSREEFEMLAQLKEPLVQLRGRWVDVRPDQIERALAFIQKHQAGQMQVADALSTALAPTTLDGVQVASVEATGWIDALLQDVQSGARTEIADEPPNFVGQLRGYQKRGVAWLSTLQRYGLGALLADDMGLGKALSLDAPLLTPVGWKNMGEIAVGDAVINAQGRASRVTGVYPQGATELFRVSFSDGVSIDCCGDHLWLVESTASGAREVRPLREFMYDLRDGNGSARYRIPLVEPIEFAPAAPPRDPYGFGIRLGARRAHDGHARGCADVRFDAAVVAETHARASVPTTATPAPPRPVPVARPAPNRIPAQYRFASIASRRALLQGLLASDSAVALDASTFEFSTDSPDLAAGVAFVVQSLGGTAQHIDHVVRIVTADRASRDIVEVVPSGTRPAQCITVDSPDGLYVTEHCIVTHNTAQVIALLLREPTRPTLVICPTSVVGNWRHELARFAPNLRVLVHHGPGRATREELGVAAVHHDVILSTYSLLHRDESSLAHVRWDGLVLDEAQNVKNASTRAAQAARAIHARWRVALTGTPVENRLADLWSIFQVVNPGYLGSAEDFRREFAMPIERASDADATARLKSLTAPFILRRVKTDRAVIADLPDKQEMKVYCSLTREQATLYEAVLQDAMRQIAESEGMQRRGQVLALLTRLKQVCNHPALLMHDGSPLAGRSGKLARLGEMLEEVVASDERALVFSQYAEMGRLLVDYLRNTLEREVIFLHGGTPMNERDRLVNEFQTDANGPPVFVLSLKAGGTGLNLTRANHVFHFDRWWNPAVENQATDRAFRIGQTRNVQVHKYVCAGTFEETLDDLIERKVQLAESIVGTSEAWITEMNTDDLRTLFRLRRDEAVAED
jgi:superfamily II DNA or RNA helicase